MPTLKDPVKIDFRKIHKQLFTALKKPEIINVPELSYLMIDGKGLPGKSKDFRSAIQALFGISYTLKFQYKHRENSVGYNDYVVPPLECLWWMEGIDYIDTSRPELWRWTLMVMQPDIIRNTDLKYAIVKATEKNGSNMYEKVRLEKFREGICVQMMHIGPYGEMEGTISAMEKFAFENGYIFRGKHHEIYITKPDVEPEKTKTIVRHPLKKK